jgi:hypothetical protein
MTTFLFVSWLEASKIRYITKMLLCTIITIFTKNVLFYMLLRVAPGYIMYNYVTNPATPRLAERTFYSAIVSFLLSTDFSFPTRQALRDSSTFTTVSTDRSSNCPPQTS